MFVLGGLVACVVTDPYRTTTRQLTPKRRCRLRCRLTVGSSDLIHTNSCTKQHLVRFVHDRIISFHVHADDFPVRQTRVSCVAMRSTLHGPQNQWSCHTLSTSWSSWPEVLSRFVRFMGPVASGPVTVCPLHGPHGQWSCQCLSSSWCQWPVVLSRIVIDH